MGGVEAFDFGEMARVIIEMALFAHEVSEQHAI